MFESGLRSCDLSLLYLDEIDPVEVFVQFELSDLLRVEHFRVIDNENEAIPVDIQHLPDFLLQVSNLPMFVQLELVLLLGPYPVDHQGMLLMDNHFQVMAVLDILHVIGNALIVPQLPLVKHQQNLVFVDLQLLLDLEFEELDGV